MLPSQPQGEFNLPALTAGIQNQGLNNFVPRENATILKNVITISANGANTGATFYQSKEFTVLQDAYAIKWIGEDFQPNDTQSLYLTAAISKTIYGNFEWTNKAGWERIKMEKIQLPIQNKKIAFSYMENYIKALEAERIETLEAERIETLEAYLTVTGLKDYHLTKKDEQIIDAFTKLSDTESRVEYLGTYSQFSMTQLFSNIKQGRRLKKDDHVAGNLPFVMAGTTNTGIASFIGNAVEKFPKHSLTIDIFGNSFYRNYEFGAGDDTGVFWDKHKYKGKEEALLYIKTVIEKDLAGKYDFGHKLRASQTYDFTFNLPSFQQVKLNTLFMSDFIKVIEKLVIKDLVEWTDKKIEVMKEVVSSV